MNNKQTGSEMNGRRIVITRAKGQNEELRKLLESHGAEVLEMPLIKISQAPNRESVVEIFSELGSYDWVVLTSPNGARAFFDVIFKAYDDIRSLGLLRFACVGKATAAEVERYHIKVECMPEKATGKDMAKALIETGSLDHAKIIVVTGNRNRPELVQLLEKDGHAIVDVLPLYKTDLIDADDATAKVFRELGADAVLFASSSAVESYAQQMNQHLKLSPTAAQPLYGSIGEQTSATMKEYKLKVSFESDNGNMKDLVEILRSRLKF